jgi:hypothetical protein
LTSWPKSDKHQKIEKIIIRKNNKNKIDKEPDLYENSTRIDTKIHKRTEGERFEDHERIVIQIHLSSYDKIYTNPIIRYESVPELKQQTQSPKHYI